MFNNNKNCLTLIIKLIITRIVIPSTNTVFFTVLEGHWEISINECHVGGQLGDAQVIILLFQCSFIKAFKVSPKQTCWIHHPPSPLLYSGMFTRHRIVFYFSSNFQDYCRWKIINKFNPKLVETCNFFPYVPYNPFFHKQWVGGFALLFYD